MQLITTIFNLLDIICKSLYVVFIISAIMSWLIAFNVINTGNRLLLHMVGDTLYRLTEPMLRPIRNLLPNFGGIDFFTAYRHSYIIVFEGWYSAASLHLDCHLKELDDCRKTNDGKELRPVSVNALPQKPPG